MEGGGGDVRVPPTAAQRRESALSRVDGEERETKSADVCLETTRIPLSARRRMGRRTRVRLSMPSSDDDELHGGSVVGTCEELEAPTGSEEEQTACSAFDAFRSPLTTTWSASTGDALIEECDNCVEGAEEPGEVVRRREKYRENVARRRCGRSGPVAVETTPRALSEP